MSKTRTKFIVPILVTVLGLTWLLNVLNVSHGVNWIVVGGLATIGILILFIGGINKLTVVLGPLLMVASVCLLLGQIGSFGGGKETPILVMTLGGLLLLSQVLTVPLPDFLKSEE